MKRGIVFVKKANMWLYYEVNNKQHVSDVMRWFASKEEAQKEYEKNGI